MASKLSYSKVFRHSQPKELEKELYSKECVAEIINFVVEETGKESTVLFSNDKFSCNLATILARDKEVVAVWVRRTKESCEVYLSKSFAWNKKDDEYINKITKYLKEISNHAPTILKDTVTEF